MTEQVVSGGADQAASSNKKPNIVGDTREPPQTGETNNNNDNPAGCAESADCVRPDKGEKMNSKSSLRTIHHKHRRHSNSERSANTTITTCKPAKGGGAHTSSSSSSLASLEGSARRAQSGAGSGEPELRGSAATGVMNGQPALSNGQQGSAPSVCSSSLAGIDKPPTGDDDESTPAADSTEQVSSAGASVQNCASNVALIPISANCNPETGNEIEASLGEQVTSNKEQSCQTFANNNSYNPLKGPNNYQRKAQDYRENQQQQDDSCKQWSITSSSGEFCKRRKLSYCQSLLLRKWPCLALSICIMSSLLFGILLSALTVYLLHGAADCSGLARVALGAEPGAGSPLLASANPHQLLRRPDYAESAGVDQLGGSSGGGEQSAQLRASSGAEAAGPTANFQRLPASLWPVHYDLFVQPHIAEPFNFTGRVSEQLAESLIRSIVQPLIERTQKPPNRIGLD